MSLKQVHLLVVNGITFIRVPFILAFFVLAVIHGWAEQRHLLREVAEPTLTCAWIALACLTISALTDLFDGALARKWKVVTKFGAMCDPLMDKVFYLIVFPTLLWLLPIGKPEERWHVLFMLVLTVLYLLRDQWVTFLRSVGSLYGADCAATFLGKFRTAMTFPLCGFIYLYIMFYDYPLEAMTIFRWAVYVGEAVAIVLNFWSIYTYTRNYAPYIRQSISEK
ncbi:MAG: CDP-alcohol phosphatidyltransferase family protein [Kiritimatiellia bacterium]